MPNRKSSSVVEILNRIERRFGKKFKKIFKTITVDNGVEFSDCKNLEKSIYNDDVRTKLFYCHPYSSYERGTNERINRDIRRLVPKGTDLTSYSDEEIKYVENWVNAYPRAIFGYTSSCTKFKEYLQAI